jgi:ribonuclease Z
MPSHRLAKIEIDDLEIIGYSVAGEETVVAIPQLDVCFDLGKAPDQVIAINHVLLTHGHMDHAAGIGYYLSHRKFCGLKPGTVLAPENLLAPIRQIVDAWGKLDGNSVPVDLVGVKGGCQHQIKPNLIARVFPVKHSYGAVGYTLIETRKKLKAEYLNLNSKQIVELKKQNVTIDYPVEIPLVTYLGDTAYADFAQLDYVSNSKILITECTFLLDEHRDRADDGKHMHVDDLLEMISKMQNQKIIVTHLTQRISVPDARKILKKKLPRQVYEKIIILMDRKWFK